MVPLSLQVINCRTLFQNVSVVLPLQCLSLSLTVLFLRRTSNDVGTAVTSRSRHPGSTQARKIRLTFSRPGNRNLTGVELCIGRFCDARLITVSSIHARVCLLPEKVATFADQQQLIHGVMAINSIEAKLN